MPATIRIDFDVHAEAISKALQAELAKVQGVVASANTVIEQSRAASAKKVVQTSIQEEQKGLVSIQALKQKAEQEIQQMREGFSAKVWGSEKKAASAIVGEIKKLQEEKEQNIYLLKKGNLSKEQADFIKSEQTKVELSLKTMRRIALENKQISQHGAGAEVGILGIGRNIEDITQKAQKLKGVFTAGLGIAAVAASMGILGKSTEGAVGQMAQAATVGLGTAAAVGEMGKALLSAEKAQKLMNLAMAAAPWALAVAAIGLTVVALSGLLDAEDQAKKALDEYTEAKKRHVRTSKELVDAFNEEGAALNNIIDYDRARFFELEKMRDAATGEERARLQTEMDNLEKFIKFEDDVRDRREKEINAFNKRNIDESTKKEAKQQEVQFDAHVLLMQALQRQAEEKEALDKKYADEQLKRIQERIDIQLEVGRIAAEGEAEQMRKLSERIALQVEVNRIAKEGEEARKQAAKEAADELSKQVQTYAQIGQSIFGLIGALKDLQRVEHQRDKEADERLEKQLAAHEAMSEANAGLAKDEKEANAIRAKGEQQRAAMMRQRDAEEEAAAEKEAAMAARQSTQNLITAASAMVVAIANYTSAVAPTGPLAPILLATGIPVLLAMFQAAKSGLGFEKGGFTGVGRNDEPAGVVHKNEFVLPAGSFAVGPDGKLVAVGGLLTGGKSNNPAESIRQGGFISATGEGGSSESIRQGGFISLHEDMKEQNQLLRDVRDLLQRKNTGRRSRMMLQRSLNRESV